MTISKRVLYTVTNLLITRIIIIINSLLRWWWLLHALAQVHKYPLPQYRDHYPTLSQLTAIFFVLLKFNRTGYSLHLAHSITKRHTPAQSSC